MARFPTLRTGGSVVGFASLGSGQRNLCSHLVEEKTSHVVEIPVLAAFAAGT